MLNDQFNYPLFSVLYLLYLTFSEFFFLDGEQTLCVDQSCLIHKGQTLDRNAKGKLGNKI